MIYGLVNTIVLVNSTAWQIFGRVIFDIKDDQDQSLPQAEDDNTD